MPVHARVHYLYILLLIGRRERSLELLQGESDPKGAFPSSKSMEKANKNQAVLPLYHTFAVRVSEGRARFAALFSALKHVPRALRHRVDGSPRRGH